MRQHYTIIVESTRARRSECFHSFVRRNLAAVVAVSSFAELYYCYRITRTAHRSIICHIRRLQCERDHKSLVKPFSWRLSGPPHWMSTPLTLLRRIVRRLWWENCRAWFPFAERGLFFPIAYLVQVVPVARVVMRWISRLTLCLVSRLVPR